MLVSARSFLTLCATAVLACAGTVASAAETRAIANPLGQNWPWELISMDFPPDTVQSGWVVTIEGIAEPRPIQIQKIQVDGKLIDRVWFIATLGRKTTEAKATFGPGSASSPLRISAENASTIIDNGVAELRLRLAGAPAGTPLNKVPHWLGGVRVKGEKVWDGQAHFDGASPIERLTVQPVAAGPVFAEWRLVYTFADPGRNGTVEAIPLQLGKQSFRYPPNQIPTETVAKEERHYEVGIRVVAGHPWIEIDERYHLPRDPAGDGSGVNQYTMEVGGRDGIPVDTMLWTRWFEYDTFGGNNSQLAEPAHPRAVQKGRPFAQLRARWAQSPATAQDCIATSGGQTAVNPAATTLPAAVGYRPEAPAIGVIAAYPSKWVGPYDATIDVQALDDNHATFRFPLTDGGKNQATGETQHYGNRCWALVAGPRQRFDTTGKIDELIRTTTDWTLTALVNRYILNWPGMGDGKVGPNPSQYLDRRYQADDVNPTNYGNRRMVNDGFERNMKSSSRFGAPAAATAYIYTDLDSWPGWHNGWGPGNPNFHTDKYMATIFAAVGMRNHPHAGDWLAFGRSCIDSDLANVVSAPDGVGSECPGYSGYSLGLQAIAARSLLDAGLGNPFADNPLVAKTFTWHRKLLTPFDRRLGLRHEAPIGDTHRWTSGADFERFIPFYEKANPSVAEELRLAQALQAANGPGGAGAEKLDWSSQAFEGFGAIFRHQFGTDQESFLSLKSGSVSGHYHNDNQSFHWYHRGTPIALDYNCSYHPRGDHAALHNTITLGQAGTIKHNGRGTDVEALEQPGGLGKVVRFVTTPTADVVVADRHIEGLTLSPVDPENSEFNRGYPERKIGADHRRLLLMSKHSLKSPLSDYLIVRDELRTTEPQQVNLHLLAREARIDGNRILLAGQYDQDILIQVVEATDMQIEQRFWAYADDWMAPPEAFLPRPGESTADWDKRLPAERPGKDWKPTYLKDASHDRWDSLIKATQGAAMMPPPGWTATWKFGECQRWLRFSTKPGTPLAMVIYPYARGTALPTIACDSNVISITSPTATDRITLSSSAGVVVNGSVMLGRDLLHP